MDRIVAAFRSLLLCHLLALCMPVTHAGSGALDPTFGTSGASFVDFPQASTDSARGVAVQADGKIVVAGTGRMGFTVVRYNADGSLDSSFDGRGRVTQSLGSTDQEAYAVALQVDGKILVAGRPSGVGGTATGGFALLRLNADGTPDAGFGVQGKVVTPAASSGEAAYAVALQTDGKIVAVGESTSDFAVVRYTSQGTLDTTFNGNGRAVVSLTAGNDVAYAVAVQPDGRILVAGAAGEWSSSDFGLARFNSDGTLDASFGTGGVVRSDFSGGRDAARAVLPQADGRIVAAGSAGSGSDTDFALVRYLADGTLDASFGAGGWASTPLLDFDDDEAAALAMQADGKLVAAGFKGSLAWGDRQVALVRYDTNGGLDGGFGDGGVVIAHLHSIGAALALQTDGRIVVAGTSRKPVRSFAAMRFLASGTPDTSFGSGGLATTYVTSSTDQAKVVALQADGRFVVAGLVAAGIGLARLDASGRIDSSFASGGRDTFSGCRLAVFCHDTVNALLVPPEGRMVVAGAAISIESFNTGATSSGPMTWTLFDAGGAWGTRTATFEAYSEALAMALQPDGKLVTVGYSFRQSFFSTGGLPRRIALARHDAIGGALDATFGSGGKVTTLVALNGSIGSAVAVQGDGKIVVAGSTWEARDSVLVRYHTDGNLDSLDVFDFGQGMGDLAESLALQADGKILMGGGAAGDGYVVRFTSPGVFDATFGTAGKVALPGGTIRRLVVQSDGKILALGSGMDLFRLNADGTFDSSFGVAGRLAVGLAGATSVADMAQQSDGRIVLAGTGRGFHSQTDDFLVMRIDPALPMPLPLRPDPESVSFGGQSMRTTSPAQTVRLVNETPAAITLGSVVASPGAVFAATHACTTIAPLSSCEMAVTFTPGRQGAVPGTLWIPNSAGELHVTLWGIGERSLVTHYYHAILDRAPDVPGKDYWEGEAARLSSLGIDINETWFVMAGSFFNSAEYTTADKSDTQFVTDLYNTFFNRAPDTRGLDHWTGQIQSGLPREIVLFSFMFSSEFRAFTQGIFGNTAARPEVDMVTDFYRGLLARLPDNAGFDFWLGQLRAAQCRGTGAVNLIVDQISRGFATSPEYDARGRSNAQYVADLYNAFLRRGGDLAGARFWIEELAAGRQTREQLRAAFLSSPEFQARVSAVIAQGCA